MIIVNIGGMKNLDSAEPSFNTGAVLEFRVIKEKAVLSELHQKR